VEARIVAVADIFDTMNSDRPYRKRIPIKRILDEMSEQSAITVDAECVKALIRYLNKNKNA
jgi:HD-GYP domain-containing protein (c-di-GMP phosphodiesterase class II)